MKDILVISAAIVMGFLYGHLISSVLDQVTRIIDLCQRAQVCL